jgi:predicted metal-dependent enzyme (double-stranded beta helix superfamily)
MFTVESFVAECLAAAEAGRGAVRDVVQRTMADTDAIIRTLGMPKLSAAKPLHQSDRLTILHITWPASYTQVPHNHLVWAEIGVYSGREDHILWRHAAPNGKREIEVVGAASLAAGSCWSLEADAIHSVNNPLDRATGSLHVYGGPLAEGPPRRMWDGETLKEMPLDPTRDIRSEESYNARFLA